MEINNDPIYVSSHDHRIGRHTAERDLASAKLEIARIDYNISTIAGQHEPLNSTGIPRITMKALLGFVRHGDMSRLKRDLEGLPAAIKPEDMVIQTSKAVALDELLAMLGIKDDVAAGHDLCAEVKALREKAATLGMIRSFLGHHVPGWASEEHAHESERERIARGLSAMEAERRDLSAKLSDAAEAHKALMTEMAQLQRAHTELVAELPHLAKCLPLPPGWELRIEGDYTRLEPPNGPALAWMGRPSGNGPQAVLGDLLHAIHKHAMLPAAAPARAVPITCLPEGWTYTKQGEMLDVRGPGGDAVTWTAAPDEGNGSSHAVMYRLLTAIVAGPAQAEEGCHGAS